MLIGCQRGAVPELDDRAVAALYVTADADALAARPDDLPTGSAACADTGVMDRGYVGLHRVVGRVAGVAGGHDALEEGLCSCVAVVATGAEDDGALLPHG